MKIRDSRDEYLETLFEIPPFIEEKTDGEKLNNYWLKKFPEVKAKNISYEEFQTISDILKKNNISLIKAKREIFILRKMFLDKKYIFSSLPQSVFNFKNLFLTRTVSRKDKIFLFRKKIQLESDCLFLDIVNFPFAFLKEYKTPKIIRKHKFKVGSPDWEFQRVGEMIGQAYSLYCEGNIKKKYDFDSYLGTEKYLEDLNKVTYKLYPFLIKYNEKIQVSTFVPNYFYVLERPISLMKIFYNFLNERYFKKLELLWVGSNLFLSDFYDYLREKGYFFQKERRFERGKFRKIAKQKHLIYYGDLDDL